MAANSKASGKATPDGAVGPQTFRSMTAIIGWWAWVLLAAGLLIDLAVQGRDHMSVVAAAVLLLVTGVAYITAERPRVIAADDGITVQNPLRDHHIPWPLVGKVDLADLLRVHVREPGAPDLEWGGKSKKIHAWAVHYSRRRQLTSDMRTRRASARAARGGSMTPFGMPSTSYGSRVSTAPAPTSQEAEAERIARMLNDRATAAGIEQATASAETSDGAVAGQQVRMVSTWSWQGLAALGVPALILLIVALV